MSGIPHLPHRLAFSLCTRPTAHRTINTNRLHRAIRRLRSNHHIRRNHMSKSFYDLLNEQIGHEFAASHQYLSMAIWLDGEDLPQLAKFFYRQSLEEREHALMMVQYKLDRGHKVEIPAVPAVKNDFENVQEIVDLSLAQEKAVTGQIEALFSAARAENYALGEQFILWFLKEQVEEVATMETLVTVVKRANGNLFDLENYVARELADDHGQESGAPAIAGS
ncbi:ferritin-like protein [Rothia mucilaginosa DY-18]|uniref:Ferritin n=2 Tax=Rothia mucilaginosa TaxID=43675 RepID=D2NQ62_ROTMD|nr:ferritin-like protein [Rothia mucilaginosa DY-18]